MYKVYYELLMCFKRFINLALYIYYYYLWIKYCCRFAGADYTFTNGEAFIIWILMAILVNNCLKK